MITETKDFDVTIPCGTEVVVTIRNASPEGGIPDAAIEYMLSGERFDSLVLRADDLTDYNFLVSHKEKIKSLSLYSDYVDWEAVSQLTNLRHLTIGDGYSNCSLNYKSLKSLTRLDIDWYKGCDESLRNLQGLTALTITRLGTESLDFLEEMNSLEYLAISHSRKLVSLNGINKFKRLRVLHLASNSLLSDINGLSECNCIELLFLNKNKKLHDYSSISKLRKLDELILVGSSDSVSWLPKLKSLTHLRMDCKLDDGNLDFLLDMKNLKFIRLKDKKGQSVKFKDIQAHLEGKGHDQQALEMGTVPSHSTDYG